MRFTLHPFERGQPAVTRKGLMIVVLAVLLSALGIAIVLYLIFVRMMG